MAVVLVVEDDTNSRILTCANLRNEYDILVAENGSRALQILESKHVDLIVADIMMPVMDGYEMIRTIREGGNDIPVIFLTAKNEFSDKRIAFKAGIDDYMTKPVNYEELILRINALLRRSRIAAENRIVVGSTVIDSSSYTVTSDAREILLPKKEFELIFKLLSYPNIIFTKNQLLDEIWGFTSESQEDTIKTHISRIRNKLRDITDFEIVTVKGVGYKAVIKENAK